MAERDIEKRTFEFSLRIVRLCKTLEKGRVGRILMNQVVRSGTSIGANVEETQGAHPSARTVERRKAHIHRRERWRGARRTAQQSRNQNKEGCQRRDAEGAEIRGEEVAAICSQCNCILSAFLCVLCGEKCLFAIIYLRRLNPHPQIINQQS